MKQFTANQSACSAQSCASASCARFESVIVRAAVLAALFCICICLHGLISLSLILGLISSLLVLVILGLLAAGGKELRQRQAMVETAA